MVFMRSLIYQKNVESSWEMIQKKLGAPNQPGRDLQSWRVNTANSSAHKIRQIADNFRILQSRKANHFFVGNLLRFSAIPTE